MSTFFAFHTSPLHLSPFPQRTPIRTPILYPTHFPSLPNRRSLGVPRFGFRHFHADGADAVIGDLFGRVESLIYTIADATVSASDAKQSGDWLSGITNVMESVLKVLKGGLSTLHVPYAYGFAIILLTVLVKASTFPLSKKQVESAMAMRSLQPQIKAIQQRYAGDQERIQLETARLYKLAGINPLAGCLPTLATIPVWIGLYRALSNVADEGLLTEGFFWIPSLSGPTTIAARQNGSGISWLFPFVDGHPPLEWSDTLAYLVLPMLLVVSQYISVQIMQSSQSNDPSQKTSQALTKFLPLMIGYFALSVPSGLSLYWFTNNILSTVQQVWLQKLGGAKIPVIKFDDDIEKGLPQIQKSVSEINSAKKELKQTEKLTSEGLRPGERFKQLKEQEARRRKQKEEEKKKAEEAAANRIPTTNGGYKNEANSIEMEYRNADDLVDSGNDSSSNIEVVVNGELCNKDSKDEPKMYVTKTESSGDSVNYEVDMKDEQHINGKLEKETIEVCTDNKTSGDETFQPRREQPTETEEV